MAKRVLTLVIEFPVGEYPEWIKKAHTSVTDGLRVTRIQEGDTVEFNDKIMNEIADWCDSLDETFLDDIDNLEIAHHKEMSAATYE